MMATQAVKAKTKIRKRNSGTSSRSAASFPARLQDTREFLHDVRLEMKQVTWPSREDVISTTTVVVIATVGSLACFLAAVDWLVQRGVTYVFKCLSLSV